MRLSTNTLPSLLLRGWWLICFGLPAGLMAQTGGDFNGLPAKSELPFNHWQLWRGSGTSDAAKNLAGSPYLHADWHPAVFHIFNHNDTLVKVSQVRVNLLNQSFDVKVRGETKVLDGSHVVKFTLPSETEGNKVFLNSRHMQPASTLERGFYELLVQGDISLFKRHYSVLVPSNYNPVLMSGNKEDKVRLKSELYLKLDNTFHLIKKNKDITDLLQDKLKGQDVKALSKKHKLNTNDEDTVISFIKELNTLQ